jgi:predicted chitinase
MQSRLRDSLLDAKPPDADHEQVSNRTNAKTHGRKDQSSSAWRSLSLRPVALQAKLQISQPHDPDEQEADHVADRVMRMVDPAQVNGASNQELQRMCNECEEEEEQPGLHRKAQSGKSQPIAPPIVHEVLSSSGQPLDRNTRSFMEPHFGSDLSNVRVHNDGRAADSASAVGARAYTVEPNIVFAAGEYAPDTTTGRQLLSHELAHVMQQRAGTAGGVQRAVPFGSMYKGKSGKVTSHLGVEYEDYKQKLKGTEASSATGGLPLRDPLGYGQLLQVFTGMAQDLADKKVDLATVELYTKQLNQAFETFKIDTVEARASYIANAWRESDQFRYMTETEKAISTNQPYQTDPTKVKLDTTWLNKAAAGKIPNVINYEEGGSINPAKDWQKSFIGRGPIQVTHRHMYVQTLAVMEKRAEDLEKENVDSPEAKNLREAIDKIKADPREAANPKYAFLFSAAFMKMPDDKGVRGDVKASKGQVTSWMGQQPAEAKKDKQKAYNLAYDVLYEQYRQEQAD